jgi:hypothetical protein
MSESSILELHFVIGYVPAYPDARLALDRFFKAGQYGGLRLSPHNWAHVEIRAHLGTMGEPAMPSYRYPLLSSHSARLPPRILQFVFSMYASGSGFMSLQTAPLDHDRPCESCSIFHVDHAFPIDMLHRVRSPIKYAYYRTSIPTSNHCGSQPPSPIPRFLCMQRIERRN